MRRTFCILVLVSALGMCASAGLAVTFTFDSGLDGFTADIDGNSGMTGSQYSSWDDPSSSVVFNPAAGTGFVGLTRSETAYHGPQANWYYINLPVVQGQEYTVTVSGSFLSYITGGGGQPWGLGARVVLFNGAGTTDHDVNPDDYVKILRKSAWNDDGGPGAGDWGTFSATMTFTAETNFVELRLTAHDKENLDDPENLMSELAAFDDITVTGLPAIPEPGSILALLSGFAGLIVVRRRR